MGTSRTFGYYNFRRSPKIIRNILIVNIKKALKKGIERMIILQIILRFYLFCLGFACALNRCYLGVMYEHPALFGTVS